MCLGPLEGRDEIDRIVGLDEVAHLAAAEREGRIGERLHAADARDVVRRGEVWRLFDRPAGRRLDERLAAYDLAPIRLCLLPREIERALAAQRLDDLVARGLERLGPAGPVLL